MLKITEKDKVFAFVVVPLALAAWFALAVLRPLSTRLGEARGRIDQLGTEEELQLARRQLEKRREAARSELEKTRTADAEARKTEAAEQGLAGGDADDAPARLRRVVAVLGGVEGVGVVRTVPAEPANGVPSASSVLVAAANDGVAASRWVFEVNADYGALLRALEAVSQGKLPVVVESLSLLKSTGTPGPVRKWNLVVSL